MPPDPDPPESSKPAEPPVERGPQADFGRILTWYDDRLIAGDDVSIGPVSHLSESLEKASIAELQRFERTLWLLREWRQLDDSDIPSDDPVARESEPRSISLEAAPITTAEEAGSTERPSSVAQPDAVDESPTPVANSKPRFDTTRLLGFGASGIVFLAFDNLLRRYVALKTPSGLGGATASHLRESAIIAGLEHPGIVQIHDLRFDNDTSWIVMAYCEGGSLAQWLAAHPGPVPPRQAAEIVAKLADALQVAHQNGVFHRDLKPGNILLTAQDGSGVRPRPDAGDTPIRRESLTDWKLKIADFGLARQVDSDSVGTAGQTIGTPAYMSPEQIEGRVADISARSDIYGLGVILFELLTGTPPYPGSTSAELRPAVTGWAVPSVRDRNPTVPRDLDWIVQCCLAKKPNDRFATAAQLADELRGHLRGWPLGGIWLSRQGPLVRFQYWFRARWPAIVLLGLLASLGVLAAIFVAIGPGAVENWKIESEWRQRLHGHQWRPVAHPGFQLAKIDSVNLDNKKRLEIKTDEIRLVELGNSQTGDIDLAINMLNTTMQYNSSVGIYWGYHEEHTLMRLPACQFQALWITSDLRNNQPVLQLRHWIMGIRSDRNKIVVDCESNLDLPYVISMDLQPMRIKVRGGKLEKIEWDGVSVTAQ